MARIVLRLSTTLPARILDSINDQPPDKDDIGRYAGWGAGDDLQAPAGKGESHGPALAPFLRYRSDDRAWRLAFGCAWIPAVIVVITVEQWLRISQDIQWISLGVVFVVFMAVAFIRVPVRRQASPPGSKATGSGP